MARRTLRTNLRFIGRRVVPQLYPADVPLPRERAKQPYSAGARSAGTSRWPAHSPRAERRMRAAGLVCLGAGAGLIRGDLRDVARHRRDLPVRRGRGHRARRPAAGGAGPVPLPRPLLAAARFAGTALICGGADPGRRNITEPADHASLAGGGGLPRLDTSRLRATWLAEVAELLGLATFMHAAGISCSQRLGDLLAALEPAGEAEAVRLLGGTGRR